MRKEDGVMGSLRETMLEYRKQIQIGKIQLAYRELMGYLQDLRVYFKNKYPGYSISGSVYQGYMDMSYFSFMPETIRQRNLKIAIVFNYGSFRFEAWLAGYNKQVQARYWRLINENDWTQYRLVPPEKGVDSILESILVDTPDFNDLEGLTRQIEDGTMQFIRDIENFLLTHQG